MNETLEWVRSQLPAPADRIAARPLTPQDREDAAMAARMLRGEDGTALLALLARATVWRPPTDPRLSGAASHDFCQRRTGENGVFAMLVGLLDMADHLEKEKRHDRSDDRADGPDRDFAGLASAFGWADGDAAGGNAGGGDGGYDYDPGGNIAVR